MLNNLYNKTNNNILKLFITIFNFFFQIFDRINSIFFFKIFDRINSINRLQNLKKKLFSN